MKAIALIARSLRLLRVVDSDEAPEARQAEDALEALNAMMCRWEADGVALGWAQVDAVTDDLPLPPEAINAVVFNLCIDIAEEYGVDPSASIERRAAEGLAAVKRDVMVANPLSYDDCGYGYDIRSDSYYGGRP